MLLVKTKIGPSTVHGMGLFADEFIPKGTVTWKRHEKFDIFFPEDMIKEIPETALEKFLWYSYFDENQKGYIICIDDQRFINHSSDNFNIQSEPDFDIACRDIQKGEELFCNYRDYEPDWFERRGYKEEDFK